MVVNDEHAIVQAERRSPPFFTIDLYIYISLPAPHLTLNLVASLSTLLWESENRPQSQSARSEQSL